MLISSFLCTLLSLLPADLQKIADNLASSEFKVRKQALIEAKKLTVDKKRLLIKELKKSSDPELSETAKALKTFLPEYLNKEKIYQCLIKDDFDKIKQALKVNPDAFSATYFDKMNIADVALLLKKEKFLNLFKQAGIKPSKTFPAVMDVLVVESDTWVSLAKDFNTTADLIKLLNIDKELKPGNVIRIPRGN